MTNASWGQPARKRSGFARSTPGSRMGASGAPAEYTARRPETEELRDGGLQEAALAGDGGWAARILLHDRLEERGVGEVAEDQVIEARPQVGELARLPRPGQDGEPLRVERPQETPERVAEIAVVVETGALDQAREVRMLFQIVEEAVEDGVHHRRLEAPALAPGSALAALRDQRDDRRDAPREHRLVQRPLVAEVMVEARLVLEPRLGGYFPHRYAGEAALGKAPLGGVEDGVARGGGFAGAGGGRPGAHALRVHEQTFVCQGRACSTVSPCRRRVSPERQHSGQKHAVPERRASVLSDDPVRLLRVGVDGMQMP